MLLASENLGSFVLGCLKKKRLGTVFLIHFEIVDDNLLHDFGTTNYRYCFRRVSSRNLWNTPGFFKRSFCFDFE